MTVATLQNESKSDQAFAIFVVPVHEYDFKAGTAEVGTADAPFRLPIDNLVSFCAGDAPGTRVLVDGDVQCLILISTNQWSLVKPYGHTTPVVVQTARVTRLTGERTLAV